MPTSLTADTKPFSGAPRAGQDLEFSAKRSSLLARSALTTSSWQLTAANASRFSCPEKVDIRTPVASLTMKLLLRVLLQLIAFVANHLRRGAEGPVLYFKGAFANLLISGAHANWKRTHINITCSRLSERRIDGRPTFALIARVIYVPHHSAVFHCASNVIVMHVLGVVTMPTEDAASHIKEAVGREHRSSSSVLQADRWAGSPCAKEDQMSNEKSTKTPSRETHEGRSCSSKRNTDCPHIRPAFGR